MQTRIQYGAAAILILAATVLAQDSGTQRPIQTTSSSALSSGTTAPIVRASTQPPKDLRDSRTAIGGVAISRPGFATAAAAAPVETPSTAPIAAPARPVRADGTIEVPLNTLGPGESLHSQRERDSADREYAQARAELARRQAEQPIVTDAFGYPLRGGYPYYGYYGAYGHYSRGPLGPIEPISSTTTGFEDQLHGTALKEYSDAAAAGTGVLGNMHQNTIRTAARAAQPPIAPIIERQQQVQRNLQKDTFKQPSKRK